MSRKFWQYGLAVINFSLLLLLFSMAGSAQAQDFFAGVRGGTTLDDGNGQFYQAEAFVRSDFTSVRWHFVSDWYLQPDFDISAGSLTDGDAHAFVGGAGPVITLGKGKFPVTLEIGGSATYLGRVRFENTDFGDHWQFTSHIGLQWQVTKHFGLGWRVQHMSNAGLANPNGGLNMQMVSLFYKF